MTETQKLEDYLLGTMQPEERLLMEANFLLKADLQEKAKWQENTYTLIRQYSRKQLRAEIEAVHNKLFTEKKFESFRQKISSIFKRKL